MKQKLRRWLEVLGGIAAVSLSAGCANFETTKAFASQGDRVTSSVKAELDFVSAECAKRDEVYALLLGKPGEANPMSVACQETDDALAQLSESTLDLFSKYNQAIAALSDGSKYDLSGSFNSTANKLKALKDKSGPVVRGESVEVVLKAANLLADVATSAIRNREMKRLLDAGGDDWPKVLSPLKTFFGPHAGNMTVQPSPYQVAVSALNGADDAIRGFLRRKTGDKGGCLPVTGKDIECEPIRATELIAEADARKKALADRISADQSKPSKTAKSVQDAIDAWIQAHEALRKDAFRLDPTQLWAQLQALKARADELNDAIAARKKG